MSINIGDHTPSFSLPCDTVNQTGKSSLSLNDFDGHWIVLYFYPKDNTSGCTKQAENFKAHYQQFKQLGCEIIGVSKDSVKSHDKFKVKFDLPFPLLSDEDGSVCNQFNVWVQKSMYGRQYYGIERSTFLINPAGKIEFIWRKVKVPQHIETVLEKLKSLHQST